MVYSACMCVCVCESQRGTDIFEDYKLQNVFVKVLQRHRDKQNLCSCPHPSICGLFHGVAREFVEEYGESKIRRQKPAASGSGICIGFITLNLLHQGDEDRYFSKSVEGIGKCEARQDLKG